VNCQRKAHARVWFSDAALELVGKMQVWWPLRLCFINLSLYLFVERGPRWALHFGLNAQNISKYGEFRRRILIILASCKIRRKFYWVSRLSPILRNFSKLWILKCGLHASLTFLSLGVDFADFRVWIHFSVRSLTKCYLLCNAILF